MRRNKRLPPYKDQSCTNVKNEEEFAWDLTGDSRIPALQLRSAQKHEFKRKFGYVQARSSQRLPDGQPAVVFYEDKDTDGSSDEEFITFEADRNSGAGTSGE